jgi:hypothetical protein
MTKKHFVAFARYIHDMQDREAARWCAGMVITVAAQDNPAFDTARFLKACGLVEALCP